MGRAIRNFKLFLTLSTVFTVMGVLYLIGDALAPSGEDTKKKPRKVTKTSSKPGSSSGSSGSSGSTLDAASRKVKQVLNKARREIDRMMR